MTLADLAIAALATYRLVRLVTVDRITEPLRDWAEMRAPWAGYLTTCSWCSAVWLSPIPSACLVHAIAHLLADRPAARSIVRSPSARRIPT